MPGFESEQNGSNNFVNSRWSTFHRSKYNDCVQTLLMDETSWRHQIEPFFRFTGHLCGEFTGEFPSQRPVTRSFDVFFDLRLNKLFCKQSRRRWFEAASRSLWRHCDDKFLTTGGLIPYDQLFYMCVCVWTFIKKMHVDVATDKVKWILICIFQYTYPCN